jgi:3',5'-cyclic AMP phosphodiesterase CpdA
MTRARLLATSDLHISHRANRVALEGVRPHPDDWLVIAGDIGEKADHLRLAIDLLGPKFARLIWTPGNHDLWCPASAAGRTRGLARYEELVGICQDAGVLTPEDPYVAHPALRDTFVVPMFLLFDYSFRPPEVPAGRAVAWARETGVLSGDEWMITPAPYDSFASWCAARCDWTAARLNALPDGAETVLINHWPLRHDLARPPRIPRFSIWSGTTRTEDWGARYRARAVVSGHLHMRTTLRREGIRYDEVSLGYPRDWNPARGLDWYFRDVLGGDDRFIPRFDPFVSDDAARRF